MRYNFCPKHFCLKLIVSAGFSPNLNTNSTICHLNGKHQTIQYENFIVSACVSNCVKEPSNTANKNPALHEFCLLNACMNAFERQNFLTQDYMSYTRQSLVGLMNFFHSLARRSTNASVLFGCQRASRLFFDNQFANSVLRLSSPLTNTFRLLEPVYQPPKVRNLVVTIVWREGG